MLLYKFDISMYSRPTHVYTSLTCTSFMRVVQPLMPETTE